MKVYEDVIYEAKDRVAVISLNRPASLNAFTAAIGQGLKRAVVDALASFASADFREGVAHFVGKRAPAFTGA